MIKYDKYGRIEYDPELHSNTGKQWNKEDLDYLINWHGKIERKEMSLALERTEGSISFKVSQLKKKGIIKKSRTNIVK